MIDPVKAEHALNEVVTHLASIRTIIEESIEKAAPFDGVDKDEKSYLNHELEACLSYTKDIKEALKPVKYAVTITVDCSHCFFCVNGAMGRKLSCGHPKIQSKRPYVDGPPEKSRSVQADSRPEWCPL